MSKLKSGGNDNSKALIALRGINSISEPVLKLFDEMYLHQCDQYSGGKVEGSYANGNLFTGLVCYMVIGLKSNVPYVVRAVSNVNLSGKWLKNELETTLDVVRQAGISVSMAFDFSGRDGQIFCVNFVLTRFGSRIASYL